MFSKFRSVFSPVVRTQWHFEERLAPIRRDANKFCRVQPFALQISIEFGQCGCQHRCAAQHDLRGHLHGAGTREHHARDIEAARAPLVAINGLSAPSCLREKGKPKAGERQIPRTADAERCAQKGMSV